MWQDLTALYDAQSVTQITQHVRDLAALNYGKFKSFEAFRQTFLNLKQFIEDFSASTTEAFHQVMMAFLLNAIGRASNDVKAQIEDGVNNRTFERPEQKVEYVFTRLISYRGLQNKDPGINTVDKQKDCSYCKKSPLGTCYVQYPEKAPK